jgi:hypothetical protein
MDPAAVQAPAPLQTVAVVTIAALAQLAGVQTIVLPA